MATNSVPERRGEIASARAVFAARLTELYAAAGNPPLHRVAAAADERARAARPAGRHSGVPVQRISDWRAGRNVPARFETFEPVLLTLVDLATARSGAVAAELVRRSAWIQCWDAARAEPDTGGGRPRPAVNTVLRRDVGVFVGRERELAAILRAMEAASGAPVHTVDGMAGAGKTALATRAAHLLADRFPDGRFFVALDAHTPGRPVVTAFDALGTLLGNLGIDPAHIPPTVEGRRDLWQGWAASRRVLLILDDARDAAQVEPLIPAGPHCSALITSRRRMMDLDGAVPISLGSLDPAEAADLFRVAAGRAAAGPEADAVATLTRLCGQLPLAIVLLAGRLAHHRAWSVTDLATELAAARHRLGELQAGDRAVRAAFTTSYADLPPGRRLLLRRMSLHPGADLDAWAAGALTDLPTAESRRELDALYTDNLVQETAPGRYRLHDLIREFGRELAEADPPADNRRALHRLLDYYRATGAGADRRLSPPPRPPARIDVAGTDPAPVREFADQAAAVGWLRLERANLLSCADHASGHDPARAIELIEVLAGLLERDGPWPLARQLFQRTHDLAQHLNDGFGIATALANLARISQVTGEFTDAGAGYRAALARYREIGDRRGEASMLTNIGIASWRDGDRIGAREVLSEALAGHHALGDPGGEATTLINLAITVWLLGHRATAMEYFRTALTRYRRMAELTGEDSTGLDNLGIGRWLTEYDADVPYFYLETLALYRDIGNRPGEASVLTNLGIVRHRTHQYREALALFRQALAIHREIGSRNGEAIVLLNLAVSYRTCGERAEAHERFEEALTAFRELGDRRGEAEVLTEFGFFLHEGGDTGQALAAFTAAADLALLTGNEAQHARARSGLALCGAPWEIPMDAATG
ncbi:tetratricopeptide repeat protein [Nocardia sp. alder85J]|uniref:tetratricopeptide repeat protein n=1 Tax=Nocardia sp. alder85J TaxID=2862949 RepID=UPI001CD33171|nr:tetratricopeptide repeat protein [Nocardia sp. alder85J]MCX4099054.1 tetratricopeptide repeat protein [Nocardia sp. alder85J]